MKDFFISYNSHDQEWAQWIAWTLEEAGYETVIQAWDFRPGSNFVLEMQRAATDTRQTIAVLSQHYLDAEFTQPEWSDAFRRDPQGNQRVLLPVRIDNCRPTGLLASIIYVNLHGLDQATARQVLLQALNERGKPDTPPLFPGGGSGAGGDRRIDTPPVEIDWDGLSGPQLAVFQEALLSAFPSRSTLAQMLLFQMDQRLDEIAGPGNQREVVYKVLEWARVESRSAALYAAARTANTGNTKLRALESELRGSAASASQATLSHASPPHASPSHASPPHASTAAESRGVAAGGNMSGNIIVTGDGNQIILPPGGAAFPGPDETDRNRESLRRQLANYEENLRLIQERKTEYVFPSQIPLQLLREERILEKRIAEVRAAL